MTSFWPNTAFITAYTTVKRKHLTKPALRRVFYLLSPTHAEKMQALFRLCLLSFRACRGISWKGTISKHARGRSKAYPPSSRSFPRFRSPYCNATRNPRKAQLGGDTLGLAVQELSLIVSLVFGAAHCAMQNSRKLRTKCSCSTLVYTAAV